MEPGSEKLACEGDRNLGGVEGGSALGPCAILGRRTHIHHRHAISGRLRLPRLFLAVLLAASVGLAGPIDLAAGVSKQEIRQTRQELRETRARIRERARRMRVVQRELNRLATRIARKEARVHDMTGEMTKLSARVKVTLRRTRRLERQLDLRSRAMYIQGPGAPILYVITATSAAEAAARVSLVSEMNRRDALLAIRVSESRQRLIRARFEVRWLQRRLELVVRQLDRDQAGLRRKLKLSQKLFAKLRGHKEQVIDELSRIRPFAVCPLQGPHAISDSFGIWVHRSEKRGGDHVHQGNDISAPMGTPIVAPFDGIAVTAENDLGGMAVKVFGEYGYVYNAHLSRYGQLGPVEKGDVIGYVGATGNALGPHDHFEWHPNEGPAADPYPFLMLVC